MAYVEIPRPLLDAAKNGTLSVLVGAGVSMNSGLPDWTKLLRKLAAVLTPDQRTSVHGFIDQARLTDAAELIRRWANAAVLVKELRESLRSLHGPSKLHELIWEVRPASVITTNYDSLLEAAYVRRFSAQLRVVIGMGPIHDDTWSDPTLYKIHGDPNHVDKLVISRADYFQTMDAAARHLASIVSLFARRPCLAVGYRFADPDLQALLYWLNTALRGYIQPIYLLTAEVNTAELALLESLPAITTIPYDSTRGHLEPLVSFFARLLAERSDQTVLETATSTEVVMLRRQVDQIRAAIHDLRTPLTSIRGLVDLFFAGHYSKDDFAERGARSIMRSAQLMQQTTDYISDLSRVSVENSLQPLDESIEYVVKSIEAYGWRSEFLRIERPSEIPTGQCPIGMSTLVMLVRILLENAYDAVDGLDAPSVTLRIDTTSEGGSRFVTIGVSDNGQGIDEAISARPFIAGASTKGSRRGFGLFLLQRIVQSVNGTVTLHSEAGAGTVARLQIPVFAQTGKADAAAMPPMKRVLIVDDDCVLGEMLSPMLGGVAEKIDMFVSSSEALESILESKEAPDLVIADLVMPVLDGLAMKDAMRRKFPRLPFLIITGKILSRDDQFNNDALCAYLEKPFEALTLNVVIRKLMASRSATQSMG